MLNTLRDRVVSLLSKRGHDFASGETAQPEPPAVAVAKREPVAVAGIGCSGPPAHRRRHWYIGTDRLVRMRDADGTELPYAVSHALTVPIPGDSQVLTLDPFRLFAVLANGSVWRADAYGCLTWRGQNTEAQMAPDKDAPPALLAAGQDLGQLWMVDAERRVGSWSVAAGKHPIGARPLPGTVLVVAIDVGGRTALLEDGTRWAWLGARWCRLGGLNDSEPGTVRVRVVSGINSASGHMVEGDVHTLPESEARDLFARGAVVEADE
jgi:hypothetical protein